MDIDPMELRKAFGSFMTGVTIVTATSDNGEPVGFTANSFTSVSLNPPLLLVCPGYHLSSIQTFRSCGSFAVNVLSENQEELSNQFATAAGERFDSVKWEKGFGDAPVLSDALTSFSCETHKVVEAGDHVILIGEVKDAIARNGRGLGYWKGGYFKLGNERLAETIPNPRQEIVVGAIIEIDGWILAKDTPDGLVLPGRQLPDQTKARDGIKSFLLESGIEAEIGRIYSIFNQPDGSRQYMYFRAESTCLQNHSSMRLLTSEQASACDWKLQAEEIMVRRYFAERNNNSFGLYVGDIEAGEVHATD